MPSTYSNLKIQLMATGENNTTWGTVTNTNLGTAIEEAIVGSTDVVFANGNVTLTLSDTNGTQPARNLRLNLTGSTGGSQRNLVVPSIEKPYIVNNGCADNIVVKTAAGSGITVPPGKTMWVYSDGTNVVDVVTHLSGLTLNTPLPISSGGLGNTTGDGSALTGLNASSVTSGTLGVARGGTGAGDPAGARVNLLPSYAGNAGKILALNAGGTDVTWVSAGGVGTVTSVNASTSLSGLSFSGGPITSAGTLALSGTLGVASGGTGQTTLTSNAVLIGNGTLGVTSVSPGASGQVLTSNGSAWVSAAPSATGVTSLTSGSGISLSGSTGAVTVTNSGVTSLVAGSGITLSASTGSITISATSTGGVTSFNSRTGTVSLLSSDVTSALGYTPPSTSGSGASGTWSISISGNAASASVASSLTTGNNYQMGSLGVGTAGSGTSGEIRATNNVTAYYSSDARLKENVKPIEGALDKVSAIGGKTFDWTDEYIEAHGGADGYFVRKSDFGVIAQDVEAVFPVAVRTREDGTLAVDYEKMCALAFQAIAELRAEVEALKRDA